jgi:hypothetical protein
MACLVLRLSILPSLLAQPVNRFLRESGQVVANSAVTDASGLRVMRPERTKIESGFCIFGSTNDVESAFPARIREEMQRNVARPRKLLADTRLFVLPFSSLKRPIIISESGVTRPELLNRAWLCAIEAQGMPKGIICESLEGNQAP